VPSAESDLLADLLGADRLAAIDLFDRQQLERVIRVCRKCPTLSAAGRALFTASRARKSSSNDADRLRKYLARFDLDWQTVSTPNSLR
jgi:transcriptional regulatory protein RtcR